MWTADHPIYMLFLQTATTKDGSTNCMEWLMYAVALRFPFTGTLNLTWRPKPVPARQCAQSDYHEVAC